MKSTLRNFIAAAAIVAAPVAANAADLRPAYKAPIAPITPIYAGWAGFYAGVFAGYGFGSSTVDVTGDALTTAFYDILGIPRSLSTSPKGWLAGLTLGYNFQSGNFVYGVETDLAFASIGGHGQGSSSDPAGPLGIVNVQTDTKIDTLGTLRARVGYAFGSTFLFYGTGGLAYGHDKVAYGIQDGIGGPLFRTEASKWNFGWTAGLGVEWAMMSRWTIKAEYLYYDIGKNDQTFNPFGLTANLSAPMKGNLVKLGLNYRF